MQDARTAHVRVDTVRDSEARSVGSWARLESDDPQRNGPPSLSEDGENSNKVSASAAGSWMSSTLPVVLLPDPTLQFSERCPPSLSP